MPFPFPTRGFRRTRERASGLYFALGVDDLSSTPITGQTLAFARASGRTVLDTQGRLATLVHSQFPWGGAYNSVEGLWEPVFDAQSGATNLCLQSENFGTTWVAVGTPTRTAAAKACGDLVLDLIGDDTAATLEGYSQVVGFTGNAVKALSLFMAAGTSTSTVVRLRDTTGAADRLLQTITWSGGVPTVTPTTGTSISVIACAGGVYRFLFQTTSVTAANTNQIEVYPATNAALGVAATGTVYAGGVQAENKVNPSSYIKTTTATVTVSTDTLTTTVTIPLDLDFTVYGRLARPSWAGLTTGWGGTLTIAGQPATGTNGRWWMEYDPANTRINAGLSQAGAGFTSFQTVPASGPFDFVAQFTGMLTAGKSRVDVGGGFSSYSSTVNPISQWQANTLNVGFEGTSAIDAGIRKLIIAPGARTLAEMRGINV